MLKESEKYYLIKKLAEENELLSKCTNANCTNNKPEDICKINKNHKIMLKLLEMK